MHGHGDGPKLRLVDEAIGSAVIRMVKRVERVGAELQIDLIIPDRKCLAQSQILIEVPWPGQAVTGSDLEPNRSLVGACGIRLAGEHVDACHTSRILH